MSIPALEQHDPRQKATMNEDQLKGTWIQFKSVLKQQWGKWTDDDEQRIEGGFNNILGMFEERNRADCASLAQKWHSDKMSELLEWAGQWQQRSQLEAPQEKTH